MEPNYENPNEGNGKKTLWIIGGIVLVIMIIGIVYGATQQTLRKKATSVDDAATPLNAGIQTNGGQTVLGTSKTVSVPAKIAGLDVVNLQTFPYKVQARVKTTLPDDCSTTASTVAQSGKVFTITVTASHPKDAACVQKATSYEEVVDIPVAGATAGTYSVKLGTIVKKFTLATDNHIEFTSDK